MIAGAAAGSAGLIRKVRENVIQLGGSMDPEAAFLLIRGMKTLEVRVERQCQNAMAVAKFLSKHPKVARVHYPGLPSHPDHNLAKRQMRALRRDDGVRPQGRPAGRAPLLRPGARVSAGGESGRGRVAGDSADLHLALQFAHAKSCAAAGVEPGTVRVSVGLEDAEDLIEDLRQALA